MAMSPFRFSAAEPRDVRTRTGLAGVTTGATSGGEGFRASALRPGSSGYMAAGFGAPPRTDYVKPVTPTPEAPPAPAAPEPAPTLAPELADPAAGAQARGGNIAEGDGANGGPGGLMAEPSMPTSGWLADALATIGLTNPGYGSGADNPDGIPGASTQPGGQADVDAEAAASAAAAAAQAAGYDGSYGPQMPSDWGGGTSTSSGAPAGASTMGGGQSDVDAEAASGGAPGASGSQSDADAAAEAEAAGGGAPGGGPSGPDQAGVEGYAKGGFVKGKRPMMGGKPGGLAQVGPVPNYAEGGMVDEASLAGPNPPGPDDGMAALDGGEFVIQAQQAQRPDYAPILAAMNAGAYQPGMEGEEAEGEEGTMPGMMPAEGHTTGDPGALPPDQQRALMDAMMADPVLAQALAQLLGPDAAHSLVDSTEETSPAPIATGRPPLAGPPPIPGAHAPPGVRPPAAAMPTQPMPPMMPPRPPGPGGLAGVMA